MSATSAESMTASLTSALLRFVISTNITYAIITRPMNTVKAGICPHTELTAPNISFIPGTSTQKDSIFLLFMLMAHMTHMPQQTKGIRYTPMISVNLLPFFRLILSKSSTAKSSAAKSTPKKWVKESASNESEKATRFPVCFPASSPSPISGIL